MVKQYCNIVWGQMLLDLRVGHFIMYTNVKLLCSTPETNIIIVCVQLFATTCTVAHHTPLSMEFSRQVYWNG